MSEDGYNFQQLKAAILPLSKANDWETARKEWRLLQVNQADERETCPCGHYPIIDLCMIGNSITGNKIEVGNVCVNRFLGIQTGTIFLALKRVRKDITKSLGPDATAHFRKQGVLNDWEYSFQQDTMRKRVLSEKQMVTRKSINMKVLQAVSRRGV